MPIKELYICEKNDIGKKLAPVLGKMLGVKPEPVGKTHIKVGDDVVVTWFAGHMLESESPEHYGFKFGDISRTPVIVDRSNWAMKPREGDWYERQLAMIKGMADDAACIINAGDAAREGQLLIDEAFSYWGMDPFGPKFMRFWARDLEKSTIEKAIGDKFQNAEKRLLYLAALARSIADFEWGMTFTSMFTAFARTAGMSEREVISIGRVQMAILRILYDREKSRREFKPVDYFIPKANCKVDAGPFTARWMTPKECLDENERLTNRSFVDEMIARCKGKTGTISECVTDKKATAQPLCNNESGMTIDCASLFDMTADETAKVGQALYSDTTIGGLMSYPRTDSRYLTQANLETLPTILKNLGEIPDFKDMVAGCDLSIRTKTIDDSKVEEHHAVIPTVDLTVDRWETLNQHQKNYCYVSIRKLLAQFYPPVSYNATSVTVACGEDRFAATGRQILDLGWRKLFSKKGADDAEEDADGSALPKMEKGDSVVLEDILPCPEKTKIPPVMTLASLTALMENPISLIREPEMRKLVRETDGIGRPSTRTKIQEKMVKRGYMGSGKKRKTEMLITDLGYDLMEVLPEELKSIGMTAMWESLLSRIASGEMTIDAFLESLNEQLKKLTDTFLEKYKAKGIPFKGMKVITPIKGDGELCPKCGKGHMKTIDLHKNGKHMRFLACDQGREACGNIIWEEKPVEKLPGDGNVCPKCGKGHLKTIDVTKSGKRYHFLCCDQGKDADGNYICDFTEFPRDFKPMADEGKICPKCGIGHLKTIQYTPDPKTPKVKQRALICDRGKGPDGKYLCDAFIKDVKPLPGDGKVCPKCGKGHLKTIDFVKEGRRIRFLSCDQGRGVCDFREFVDERPPPKAIAGDGKLCPECKKGHMKTGWQWSNQHKKDFIVLRCDNDSCKKIEFPKKG